MFPIATKSLRYLRFLTNLMKIDIDKKEKIKYNIFKLVVANLETAICSWQYSGQILS